MTRFANFDVVPQSWYVAGRARDFKPGRPKSLQLLNRRIVLWRDAAGRLHALDARCPHLGADLGDGDVIDGNLRCAFHHWQFDPAGRCRHAPGLAEPPPRRARSYPVFERWGLAWLFNGPIPTFDLPPAPANRRVWRLPRQFIKCHPHLVVGNGLDAGHFEALHGLRFSREPILRDTPNGLALEIACRPTARRLQFLTGTRDRDVEAIFTTIGGNIAWLEIRSPLTFEVLFTGLPADGGCWTQTLLFLPKGFGLRTFRALFILHAVLSDDRRILDHLDFHPSWTTRDEPVRGFADKIDQMDVW